MEIYRLRTFRYTIIDPDVLDSNSVKNSALKTICAHQLWRPSGCMPPAPSGICHVGVVMHVIEEKGEEELTIRLFF
ncbi:hypothetical protein [Paenibacillus solani]|uniref:Uncharacterized protein n=1 Tax=Paenibacillus solani TaxID=1705565 RepID=A0A0M1P4N2_9BACL|nr:hypothetical protein [Paenibacillus solani]KOR89342.1 hypothetical protein AM231_09430 [Paenibacillus solani]